MTTPATHESLRDCFSAIFDKAAQDPVEHIVALTYEFHDQQLLNLLAGRPMDENFQPRNFDLKKISALAPVVIYDARKTTEANLVPHFMELLPVKMPAFSCHHSKAYLVATRDSVHLLLGSMNLTHTGLFRNREVFQQFQWNATQAQDIELLSDFTEVLAQHRQVFGSASLDSAIAGLRRRIEAWTPKVAAVRRHHLVASGYGGLTGLVRLAELWRDLSDGDAVREVFAVSPFFDKGTGQTLAAMLNASLGPVAALHLVTDAACLPKLGKQHFSGVAEQTLHLIAAEVGEAEKHRIELANDRSAGGLNLERNLHAKILVLAGEKGYLVYLGSANFTCKAWNGDNRELGVAWFERGKPGPFIDRIVYALHADVSVECGQLPDVPPDNTVEDEDYRELAQYPEFVQAIMLKESQQAESFEFEITASDLEPLAGYDVFWGSRLLTFAGAVSRPIAGGELFARLLGGRNLRFVWRQDRSLEYFLPFRHSAALFEQRELHLHLSAEDWILYQLGIGESTTADPDEVLPGDQPSGEPPFGDQIFDIDREGNTTIRIQRYLSLFSRLESDFKRRAESVQTLSEPDRAVAWKGKIATPIETFASVLVRQPALSEGDALHRLFQLGELALLAKSLPGDGDAALKLSGAVVARMPSVSMDPVVNRYIQFCGSPNGSPKF